ncbi:MAG: TolC family protein [Gammaproteobacteria bacterium]|nr:TolC family protein [Gammaproteobacteria bacterium]
MVSMQLSPEHPLLPARAIDLAAPLTDLDAARLALIASPDLNATRAQAGVSQAQLYAAGLVPDPQLSLSVDRPDAAGLVNAMAAGLTFDLASLFTHADRVAGARSNVAKVRLDVAWSEWLALNQVRTLVRRILALERQVAVAGQAEAAAAELYELAERNMTLGDARLDDVTVYQIGYLDAQDRLLALKRQLTAARQELNAVIGIPPHMALALSSASQLHSLEALDVNALVSEAAHGRLDIRALQAGYAAQERGVRVATRNALPLPQLSFNRTRDTSAIWTGGVGIGAALPLWNRNRGEISMATATRAQLAAEYAARIHRARADIFAQVEDLRAIDAERRALAGEIPRLEESARVIAQATRESSLPLVTYETVRAALLAKQLSLLALEQAQSEGEVVLETSIGKLLWETP